MSQESPFYFPSKASRRPSLRTAALSVPSYPSSNPSRQPLLPNIAEDTQHYTNNSNRAFSDDDGKNQKRNPYQSTGGRSWDWAGSSKYQSKGYALSASTRSQRYWRAVKYFWPFVLSATLALAYMGLHFVLIPYKIQAAIDNGNALAQIDVLDIIQGPSGSSRNTLIVNGKGSTEVGEGPRAIPMTMHSAPLSISLSINGGSPKPLFQTRIPRIHIPRTGNVALIHGQEPLDILDIDLLREFLSKALTAIDTAPPVSYAMAMSSRPVFTSSWILGGSWKASYERTREFLLGGKLLWFYWEALSRHEATILTHVN